MQIRISLDTKFQLKLTILFFWTKFYQKGYLLSKTEEVNTTIELCIIKIVKVLTISLNWQFWFLGPNLSKKGISSLKQKKEHHYWILQIRITLDAKFKLKLTILILWTKFTPKKVFSEIVKSSWKRKKWTSPLNSEDSN